MRRANLNRLEYFVAIAEEGTITAAAERMRISKAVVSKQLQLLEDDLGSTLVVRNSRHLNLTEVGEAFYQSARAAIAQAEEAYDMVQQGRETPTGNLRITAPLDLGTDYVAPAIAQFRALYPAVTVDLTLSDARFDPVEARFDIAYRVGWLSDSSNVARKLAGFQQFVVGAPDLIGVKAHSHPSDLNAFPFIEHRALPTPSQWRFAQAGRKDVVVDMTPAVSADVTPVIKAMTLQGAGLSVLPDFYVQDEIENGTLIRLASEWHLPSGGIYAIYPPTPFRSSATRRFAELFERALKKRLNS